MRSMSQPSNAARKLSCLRRIVSHESPDWNDSSTSISKSSRSPCIGLPQTSSW